MTSSCTLPNFHWFFKFINVYVIILNVFSSPIVKTFIIVSTFLYNKFFKILSCHQFKIDQNFCDTPPPTSSKLVGFGGITDSQWLGRDRVRERHNLLGPQKQVPMIRIPPIFVFHHLTSYYVHLPPSSNHQSFCGSPFRVPSPFGSSTSTRLFQDLLDL